MQQFMKQRTESLWCSVHQKPDSLLRQVSEGTAPLEHSIFWCLRGLAGDENLSSWLGARKRTIFFWALVIQLRYHCQGQDAGELVVSSANTDLHLPHRPATGVTTCVIRTVACLPFLSLICLILPLPRVAGFFTISPRSSRPSWEHGTPKGCPHNFLPSSVKVMWTTVF